MQRKGTRDPKLPINPLYNTSAIIKAVGDKLNSVMGNSPKKKPK